MRVSLTLNEKKLRIVTFFFKKKIRGGVEEARGRGEDIEVFLLTSFCGYERG